jgi:hypothetical protein
MNILGLDSLSPFQLFTRKSEHADRVRETEHRHHQHGKTENSQRSRLGNPEKLVENQLTDSIQKATDTQFVSAPANIGKELDSDKLAERILANIAKSYGEQLKADPNFDKANFLSQVKQGVEDGFAQARDALDQLGLLNDAQSANLDDAYATIQDGLSKLETSLNPANTTQVQTQGVAAQISQTAEIEIVTQEGDVVKIRLAESGSMSQSIAQVKQNGQEATAFESSSESSSDFSISIEGDLNEDEQKSLKKLLKQMDKVGKEFFSDNIQGAFKQAQKIGLDTEQLASFSMNLSMEKSVQAISTYQQTAAPEQNLATDKIQQISDFFNRARADLQPSQDALKPFADPVSAFNSLFEAVNKMLTAQNPSQETDDTQPTLPEFARSLGLPEVSA